MSILHFTSFSFFLLLELSFFVLRYYLSLHRNNLKPKSYNFSHSLSLSFFCLFLLYTLTRELSKSLSYCSSHFPSLYSIISVSFLSFFCPSHTFILQYPSFSTLLSCRTNYLCPYYTFLFHSLLLFHLSPFFSFFYPFLSSPFLFSLSLSLSLPLSLSLSLSHSLSFSSIWTKHEKYPNSVAMFAAATSVRANRVFDN